MVGVGARDEARLPDDLGVGEVSRYLDGALGNYVCLGEIPDHSVTGSQGFWQHQVMLSEIESRGVVNSVPLYRGAVRGPEEELLDPGHVGFLSYTSDRKIAVKFAKGKPGGQVYVVPIGSVRGVEVKKYEYELPDQWEEYGFSYHSHESEWLVRLL